MSVTTFAVGKSYWAGHFDEFYCEFNALYSFNADSQCRWHIIHGSIEFMLIVILGKAFYVNHLNIYFK